MAISAFAMGIGGALLTYTIPSLFLLLLRGRCKNSGVAARILMSQPCRFANSNANDF